MTKKRLPEERFIEKVKVLSDDECWEWQAGKFKSGYGAFWDGHRDRRAHVYAYEWHYREKVPKGMCVLHHCDNPPCCNPFHLRVGTNEENMQDKKDRGRAIGKAGKWETAKTHCPKGHEYTPENTRVYRGKRYCITCNRVYAANTRKRKKAVPILG